MTATRPDFLKPAKRSADAKVAQTNATARTILDAEATARDKKTRDLRALRLAQPSLAQPPVETPRKKSIRK
ncbi:hypothetical protein B5K06_29225 [Rhizobium grahamii]|uniref:Uncharacterized protein n=1 Tax=Rhizobium grahamii TaxID=1120045 RepID=A0A370KH41_9HYPH|nr:hypothetical protein [Rhizobium grahamii]RDJ03987.1 hypothetical protein B5K06_29225 [Rhizobium grahamii]